MEASLSLAQLLEAGRDARALGLARAPDGASWITLTSQFERAVRDLRLALGGVGLAVGSRTPLDRIERRGELQPAFDELDAACAELARALEVNRGRDAELDLLIARVAELRRELSNWSRELNKGVDGDDSSEPDGDDTAVGALDLGIGLRRAVQPDSSRARQGACACTRGATAVMGVDFGDADRGWAVRSLSGRSRHRRRIDRTLEQPVRFSGAGAALSASVDAFTLRRRTLRKASRKRRGLWCARTVAEHSSCAQRCALSTKWPSACGS